jgi:hypothetical protein
MTQHPTTLATNTKATHTLEANGCCDIQADEPQRCPH